MASAGREKEWGDGDPTNSVFSLVSESILKLPIKEGWRISQLESEREGYTPNQALPVTKQVALELRGVHHGATPRQSLDPHAPPGMSHAPPGMSQGSHGGPGRPPRPGGRQTYCLAPGPPERLPPPASLTSAACFPPPLSLSHQDEGAPLSSFRGSHKLYRPITLNYWRCLGLKWKLKPVRKFCPQSP